MQAVFSGRPSIPARGLSGDVCIWSCKLRIESTTSYWIPLGDESPACRECLTAYPGQKCSVQYVGIYALLRLTDSICEVDYHAAKIVVYLRVLIEAILRDPWDRSSDTSPRNKYKHFLEILLMRALGLQSPYPVILYATTRARALYSESSADSWAKTSYEFEIAFAYDSAKAEVSARFSSCGWKAQSRAPALPSRSLETQIELETARMRWSRQGDPLRVARRGRARCWRSQRAVTTQVRTVDGWDEWQRVRRDANTHRG